MNFHYFDAGWFGINILVPVGGPLLALWIISKLKVFATMAKKIVIKSIGKGELLWAVMGMAASTIYELDSFKSIATDADLIKMASWAIGLHIFIIVVAVLMVGCNSLEPVPPPAPATGPAPPPPPPHPIPDRFIFGTSLFCLIFVILTYSGVHTKLSEQEANARETAIMKAQECVTRGRSNAQHCMEDLK